MVPLKNTSSLLAANSLIVYHRTPLFAGYTVSAILEKIKESRQTVNRSYKDSVFVDLFSEDTKAKENLLSLYNALHNTHLDSVSALTPLRLEQVMYMTRSTWYIRVPC